MFDYLIAGIFGFICIAALIFAFWYSTTYEPRLVRPGEKGIATSRIETAIRKTFSGVEFDADDPVQSLKQFRPNDIWATLVYMLEKEQLIESQDDSELFRYSIV